MCTQITATPTMTFASTSAPTTYGKIPCGICSTGVRTPFSAVGTSLEHSSIALACPLPWLTVLPARTLGTYLRLQHSSSLQLWSVAPLLGQLAAERLPLVLA